MATRLFLRQTTGFIGSHAVTELSAANALNAAGPTQAARDLSTTKGAGNTTLAWNTPNSASNLLYYCGKWISDTLGQTDIAANNWTIRWGSQESSTNANAFLRPVIYVVTSADSVRGFISDTTTNIGAEWATSADGQVVTTVAGSAVAGIQNGDQLVFELWANTNISMAGVYTLTFNYDGTTDPILDSTTSQFASSIETPEDITFGTIPDAATVKQLTALGVG